VKNLPERRQRFMRFRIGLLYAFVLLGAAIVLRRAYDLQVEQAPRLREMAEEQHSKQINVPPKRGTLRDRNGAELAITVEVDSVYANPRRIAASGVPPAQIAARLASLLGVVAH
jgi:cell division protein FtsI (penicillin-binding protein 3)